jgi:hypothetical protein
MIRASVALSGRSFTLCEKKQSMKATTTPQVQQAFLAV